jgi:hypothetical protein
MRRTSIFSYPLPKYTAGTPLNVPFTHSKTISSLDSSRPTGISLSNCGTNYYPSASSLSTISDAQELIHIYLPKPTCMEPLISTTLFSLHQAQKLSFMRNPMYIKHGLLTPSKVGTLALPFTTTTSVHVPPMQKD